MKRHSLTPSQIQDFRRDGYLFVPGLMSADEVELLQNVADADTERRKTVRAMPDVKGRESKLWFETKVRDDFYGAIVHWDRIVEPLEQLLGGFVHQLHHKLMVKDPRVGGAWEWHQDYGYWYQDGFLFPNLISCMIAVNRASKENGCLQVLKGSHLAGRIAHGTVGGQTGADKDRVEQMAARLETVHCEMEPGTALFFHCNTLHCSAPNTSDQPRSSLICCYNAMSNKCFSTRNPHGAAEQLEKWPDSRVLEIGRRQLTALRETSAV